MVPQMLRKYRTVYRQAKKWYNRGMNKQMTMSLISDELRQAATPKKELLERMDRIIPRNRWTELVLPYYYKGEHGNKPYPLE